MTRPAFLALVALTAVLGSLPAQDRPRPAKLKKYDAERSVVVLTVDGTDGEYALTKTTRVMDASMKQIPADGLKAALKDGASVMFLAAKRDGKNVLVGLRIDGAALPAADVAKLRPLMELGEGKYQGFVGGLYPDGKNVRREAHEKAGLALAAKVEPLDADGKPSKDGKIVLLSVGMSNTNQVFGGFKPLADRDRDKNPRVVVVNGAQGGMTAARIMDPESDGGKKYWTRTDEILGGVLRFSQWTGEQMADGPT